MEVLVLVVAIALIAYFVLNKGTSKSTQPRQGEKYACSGCGVQVRHNKRTVSAWERGSRSFFCQDCHKNWREEQAKKQTTSSGCLGSLAILVVIPLIIGYGVYVVI